MKSARELDSVGTTTIPRLENKESGTVPIMFLTKDDLIALASAIDSTEDLTKLKKDDLIKIIMGEK